MECNEVINVLLVLFIVFPRLACISFFMSNLCCFRVLFVFFVAIVAQATVRCSGMFVHDRIARYQAPVTR